MKFIVSLTICALTPRDSFGSLKAALEGSLSGNNENIIFYATSTGGIYKEAFRQGKRYSPQRRMEEQLSMYDRSGYDNFVTPTKRITLTSLKSLRLTGICGLTRPLCAAAERWAINPRRTLAECAKQFIDMFESAEKRGKIGKQSLTNLTT
jgi:predicted AAA+ superfamily ATPase